MAEARLLAGLTDEGTEQRIPMDSLQSVLICLSSPLWCVELGPVDLDNVSEVLSVENSC